MLEVAYRFRIKRLFVKVLSYIVYFTGLYFILNTFFKRNGVYIVFYHSIIDKHKARNFGKFISLSAVEKKNFEKQIKYFKKNFNLISMNEAAKILKSKEPVKGRYLVVTLDDGYKDNYLNGYDLFKKYDIKPTIFLTANNIENGSSLWPDLLRSIIYNSKAKAVSIDIFETRCDASLTSSKDKIRFLNFIRENLKTYDEERKYSIISLLAKRLNVQAETGYSLMLTWEEAQMLASIGADIGAHTLNHPILSKLSREEAITEIRGSKELIEEKLNALVHNFAYPNGKPGDFNDFIASEVRKSYNTAVTTVYGINYGGDDLMRLKRIGMAYDMGIADLKVKILYLCILESIKKSKEY
jgi:peptidoglycan/xylan/chitin deacetylase (PgdA/CDA1 family)